MSETAKWFSGRLALFPLLLIVLALAFMPGRKQNELSYQQFKQVLESGDVGSLVIYQNEQTPTGEVRLANRAGEVYVTYVSDVNQIQQMLQDMDIDYSMNDVPQTSYWMSILLPVAVSVGAGRSDADHHEYESRCRRRDQCQDDELWQEPRPHDQHQQCHL